MDTDSRIAALEAQIAAMVADKGVGQGAAQQGKFEKDIYYRRSLDAEEQAGWITTGPQLSGTSVRDFSIRGFVPLWQFGTIPHDEKNKWRTILRHPEGPGAFPIDQIITLRWYKTPPVEGVKFSQITGHKVKEFRCPQCRNRLPFIQVDGWGGVADLGIHLAVMHKWDRQSIQAYGKDIGVDFTAIDAVRDIVTEIELGEPHEPVEEAVEDIVTEQCEHCEYTGTPNQVRGHKMGAHKQFKPKTPAPTEEKAPVG